MIHKLSSSDKIITILDRQIGFYHPTYFIADIAANHNGSLEQAKNLIRLAKEAGANAAKFQHFKAEKIVSRQGFELLKGKLSHQAKWKKSVFQVYQEASVPWEWTDELVRTCREVGIHFFSAPYDFDSIDKLDAYMPAYKVGSGDITWWEALTRMAQKKKPIFLATGASEMNEVKKAVQIITAINPQLCLMQCNTNYTANLENFKYINLNVLKTYAKKFSNIVLGLSDHTLGNTTVLGAVALGARVIEKHFTDNRKQEGPDHAFSMEPLEWKEMVARVRELELAMGSDTKKVEENEKQSVLIQRRCCRAAADFDRGHILKHEDIEMLRPVQAGAFLPYEIEKLIGRKLATPICKGSAICPSMLIRHS